MLKTVDRYILREWLKIFGLAIAVTLGLLVLNDMYSNFGDLMDYRAGLAQILLYYVVVIPSFVPLVLPIALLLSLLFSLGNLHRNNEFVALRASGFSIGRLTITIWVSAGLLSVALLFMNARVVPWSVEQSRQIFENIQYAHFAAAQDGGDVGMIHALAFDNRPENRIWFMNRFSAFTYRGFGVNVYKLDERRREIERIMAREAHFDDFRNEWFFHDGRRMIFDSATGQVVRSMEFDQLVDDDLNETPRAIILFNKRPRDLSLNEIRFVIDAMGDDNPRIGSFQVRYHSIIAGAFSCLIIVGLAIPFATTGVRVNPMVGVSKSLGLFLFYFVLENAGRIIGERDLIDPVAAAWLPAFVMTILAAWLFRRAI